MKMAFVEITQFISYTHEHEWTLHRDYDILLMRLIKSSWKGAELKSLTNLNKLVVL